MKIVDTILYNGEIDMLLLRLKNYNDYIDHFIIVEADKSFTNIIKTELYTTLIKNDERFNIYLNKIEILIYPIVSNECWLNEKNSRNYTKESKIIKNLNNDDLILHSDCDEILRQITLEKIKFLKPNIIFGFKNIFFCLKWHFPSEHFSTILVTKKVFLENDIHGLKLNLRNNVKTHYRLETGWHFSFFGDIDFIIKKINSFSHQEMNRPEYNNKEYILNEIIKKGNGIDFFSVDWNKGNVPQLILNNLNDLPNNINLIDKFDLI